LGRPFSLSNNLTVSHTIMTDSAFAVFWREEHRQALVDIRAGLRRGCGSFFLAGLCACLG
jgi:hypothetical protein